MTVREELVDRLARDLVGPDSPDEVLSYRPSDIYLTGILWPQRTPMGGEDDDRLANGEPDEGSEEGSDVGQINVQQMMRPSVAGVSFALSGKPALINVSVEFAHYIAGEDSKGKRNWTRRQVFVDFPEIICDGKIFTKKIPKGPDGNSIHIRSLKQNSNGNVIVTVTLINRATGDNRLQMEEATLFQTNIIVRPGPGTRIEPRPSNRAILDQDDAANDLLYRKIHEYAAGHTCSADWSFNDKNEIAEVRSTWLPTEVVKATNVNGHAVFGSLVSSEQSPLSAEWLSTCEAGDLARTLKQVPEAYSKWIGIQRNQERELDPKYKSAAADHLRHCEKVASRMSEGATIIGNDPDLTAAFRLANSAMALQFEWSQARRGVQRSELRKLRWHPFQLGFILLTAASAADPEHSDRDLMDLLWFPTGGGKTEAYLGLIAFLAFARRLKFQDAGAGVTVLMRYTLRLLTTQQFSRAAAVILACEMIRRGKVPVRDAGRNFGKTPFSIGLWVGNDATPNKIVDGCAALQNQSGSTPRQLVNCPCCGRRLDWTCHRANEVPAAIHVRCRNTDCTAYDPRMPLPVWTVDEDVYRERPTLLIGTVDKFAQIPRRQEIAALFNVGGSHPPDLVIQDELHLISGALGTLVSLYECAIDRLFSRGNKRPKVIGSTATIRRAHQQVSALFDRDTSQFPPPALDAADSGFAVTDSKKSGRKYIAVTTAGRSAKFTLQAVSASLLQAGADLPATATERDPYWTLVGYFNALRELGGALVLMQDDVPRSIQLFADRHGSDVRELQPASELTSRRSQHEIVEMLDDMEKTIATGSALDVVLATNMISVGVDVPRLGLMLVNGQPKGRAEYIQATSRVGRQHPGLVVCVLNNAKARDRSHYETFRTWHSTLYRDVEATSVTPFAPRARDRALHAPLAALVRHLIPGLGDKPKLTGADELSVRQFVTYLTDRANRIDPEETEVGRELSQFITEWIAKAPSGWWTDRQPSRSLLISAERAVVTGRTPGRGIPRSTPNSMRNVEAGVPFRLAPFLRNRDED